jgi:hypothetical protein
MLAHWQAMTPAQCQSSKDKAVIIVNAGSSAQQSMREGQKGDANHVLPSL